eukprot:590511_1
MAQITLDIVQPQSQNDDPNAANKNANTNPHGNKRRRHDDTNTHPLARMPKPRLPLLKQRAKPSSFAQALHPCHIWDDNEIINYHVQSFVNLRRTLAGSTPCICNTPFTLSARINNLFSTSISLSINSVNGLANPHQHRHRHDIDNAAANDEAKTNAASPSHQDNDNDEIMDDNGADV